jgi:hypothetical protein
MGVGGVTTSAQRVLQVLALITLVALAFLSVLFYISGAHKNNQINQLQHHGVAINAKVTGCLGLLGGSGSNKAGYICTVHFTRDGKYHNETVPGSAFLRPGHTIRAVILPSDPGLISTPPILASEHSSGNVYILPTIFLALFLILGAFTMLWFRRIGAAKLASPTPSS